MKAEEIIKQLHAVLPRYTDLFSDDISITSIVRSGNEVTVVCSDKHKLTVGDNIYIYGAITQSTISNLTYQQNLGTYPNVDYYAYIATAITLYNHDLTLNYQETVNIIGANESAYNGEHQLIDVQNRKTFTYLLSSEPSGIGTGTIKLIDNLKKGYNGFKNVNQIIDDYTFTYLIDSEPETPAICDNAILRKGFRISGLISAEMISEIYTPQEAPNNNKLWAFVVLGAAFASKDRNSNDDGIYEHTKGVDYRQRILQPFTIFVVVPCTSYIAAREARDLMEDVRALLYKAILGAHFDSGLFMDTTSDRNDFGIVFAGHAFYSYNGGYYIHRFDFESRYQILQDDTCDLDDSVAFRDVRLKINTDLMPDHREIMNTNVDLDEIPL